VSADETLAGTLVSCGTVIAATDPVLEARLRRLVDCFVGCLGLGFGVVPRDVA
jgi:hypothetical protein